MMPSLSGHVGSRVTRRLRTSARHGSGIGTCCALIMACVVAIAPDGIAQAQVVERNLPPEPPRRASAIKIDTNDLLKSDDATPLGVNVQAIVLIGANAGAKQARRRQGCRCKSGQRARRRRASRATHAIRRSAAQPQADCRSAGGGGRRVPRSRAAVRVGHAAAAGSIVRRAPAPRDPLQGRRHQGDGSRSRELPAKPHPPRPRTGNRCPQTRDRSRLGQPQSVSAGRSGVRSRQGSRPDRRQYRGDGPQAVAGVRRLCQQRHAPDRPQSLLCRGQRGAVRRYRRVLSAHRQRQFLDGRRAVQPARRRQVCQSGGAVAHAARIAHESRSRGRSCADQ